MKNKYFILFLWGLLLVTSVFSQTPQLTVEERDPEPYEFVLADRQPEPLNLWEILRRIEYPKYCKEHYIVGKFFVKLLIDKDGNPINHKVLRSPHELVTQAVLFEIYCLKFSPAIKDGKPIKCWISLPYEPHIR